MKVKCDNCGMIYRLQPWLGDMYDYPQDYEIIDKCPKCSSNAYTELEKIVISDTTNPTGKEQI